MKYFLLIASSILFTSCNPSPNQKKGEVLESLDTVSKMEQIQLKAIPETHSPKIDLDAALADELDDHLTDLREGVLGLCCYDLLEVRLNYDYFRESVEISEKDSMEIKVYRGGKSFFKTYYNDHPKVMSVILFSGRLLENEAIANPEIQLGMPKNQLLNLLFKPSPLFDKFTQMDIYENEYGDAYTSYVFAGDSLAEIHFH
ncbi:MAG: hypothetical protein R8P61_37440 [Bacteroidia bacterium]|nr:hypothetical protein [Bacteroidia bacterium]